MKLRDFERAVARHGSDLSRWPTSLVPAAERLLARDERAAIWLAEEQILAIHLPRHYAAAAAAISQDDVDRLTQSVMARLPLVATDTAPGFATPWFAGDWFARFVLPMAVAAVLGIVVGGQMTAQVTSGVPVSTTTEQPLISLLSQSHLQPFILLSSGS